MIRFYGSFLIYFKIRFWILVIVIKFYTFFVFFDDIIHYYKQMLKKL
jgi:hypothetical protein